MDVFSQTTHAVAAEFSDLSAPQAAALVIRLVTAGALGALLGWEREKQRKAAGLRTHILVAVGAAGFVAIPQQAGFTADGVGRVMQGLVAGIGFLGAGCILKSEADGQITGLTTAAGIWLTAAVGVAAGMGREASALVLGTFGWLTLAVLGRWEGRADRRGESGGTPGTRQ